MKLQSILPQIIGGAVGATVLRFVLNQTWTVNNVGLIDRTFPFPLSEWWMWAIGGMAIALIQRIRRHHARLDIEAWAQQFGGTFQETAEQGDLGDLTRFGLFDNWSAATNRVSCTVADQRCDLFDYTSIERGETDTYRTQTVLLMPELDFALPVFELRPQGYYTGLLRTMTSILGLQITVNAKATRRETETVTRFNHRYRLFPATVDHIVKAARGECPEPNDDIESLRSLFSTDLLNFFADRPGWCVESTGDGLAIWKMARVARAAERQAMLDHGQAIVDTLRQALETPATTGIDFKVDPVDERTLRWGFRRFAMCVFGGFFLGGAVGMALFFRSAMADDEQFGHGASLLALFFLPILVGLAGGGLLAWWLARRR